MNEPVELLVGVLIILAIGFSVFCIGNSICNYFVRKSETKEQKKKPKRKPAPRKRTRKRK